MGLVLFGSLWASPPEVRATVVVDASAVAQAHQGPNVITTSAHVRNGALVPSDNFTGPLGTVITAGPLGPGATSANASVLQNGFSLSGDNISAGASASADLVTGALRAGVSGNPINNFGTPRGIGDARFSDTLTFVNATVTDLVLPISWEVNGTIIDQAGGGEFVTSFLNFSTPAISQPVGLQGAPAGFDNLRYFYSNGGPLVDGVFGNYLLPNPIWTVSGSGLDKLMQSSLIFHPGTTIIDFGASLNVDCGGGSICDYTHTAELSFGALPAGLSFTSESGVFLSGVTTPVPDPVPEPSTWLLMGTGLLALLYCERRRRKQA